MRNALFFAFMVVISIDPTYSQGVRFLGSDINYPGFNKKYPAFSGDGKSLAFMYDYTNDGGFITLYTYKDGIDWVKPVEVSNLHPEKVNLEGGFCLDYTGEVLFFTSRRSNSIGGYDLWSISRGSNGWSNARNLGIPVNTSGHEAFPSLSTDGNTLYFSRCKDVSNDGFAGCKIMMSKKKKGQRGGWEEPIELPPPVNMGNDAAPKILSDGVSLVFASDRPGGKGNIDLYFTRLEDGDWSKPQNMEFVNTDGYDISYSMYYRADQAIIAATDRRNKKSLGYVRVPPEFQPKKVLNITGIITFQDPEANGNLIVRNFDSGEIVSRVSLRNESNPYEIILPSEGTFEFYVETQNPRLSFYSEIYDTESLSSSSKRTLDIELEVISDGTVIPLNALYFEEDGYDVDMRSKNELARLDRIIKNNPNYNFDFLVFQDTVLIDSIRSALISETKLDTVKQWVLKDTVVYTPAFETDKLDSMLIAWNDSLSNTFYDSLIVDHLLTELIIADSVEIETVITSYTSDKTPRKAEALRKKFDTNSNVTSEGMGNLAKPKGKWSKYQLENGYAVVVIEEED